MKLFGTYGGIVEANNDPEKLGRVKVRAPHVYGSTVSGSGYISTNDLPWALPAGMPAGGSGQAGGFSHIPEIGDKVWVRFLDGEPEKPVWEWGMQSVGDRDTFSLHSYRANADGSVGSPDRAFWTRYGHGIELNAGGLTIITSAGYRVVITDASAAGLNDGNINITTPLGNSMKLDDIDNTLQFISLEDFNVQIGRAATQYSESYAWRTLAGDYTVDSGREIILTSTENLSLQTISDLIIDSLQNITATAVGNIDFTSTIDTQFKFATLRLGATATEPFVLGTQLTAFLNSLLTYLTAHTHSNGNNGSPTGPPIVPPLGVVQPTTALLTSKVILGQ
jgi:hypothetical protein